jgi:mycofactocin biosynthetic radical S-adenosylmethionine protein MftC
MRSMQAGRFPVLDGAADARAPITRALATAINDPAAAEAKLLSQPDKVRDASRGIVPVPSVVELFLTNHCNFRCAHCRCRPLHGGPDDHVALDLLDTLLGDLSARGVAALELSGGGESLEHPEFPSIIEMLKKHGMRFSMITNGYRFVREPRLLDQALPLLDWIRFSIDGFTEESYERVHGVKNISYSALKTMIAGIPRSSLGLPVVGAKITISRLNVGDVPLVGREATAMHVDYLQYKLLSFPTEIVLGQAERRAVVAAIRDELASRKTSMNAELMPPYADAQDHGERCLMTFLHPVVDWDGEIYLCAFFEHRRRAHSIGNIRDGGFFKHWESAAHLKAFANIDPRSCVPNCPMRRYNRMVDWIVSNPLPEPATIAAIRAKYPTFRYV